LSRARDSRSRRLAASALDAVSAAITGVVTGATTVVTGVATAAVTTAVTGAVTAASIGVGFRLTALRSVFVARSVGAGFSRCVVSREGRRRVSGVRLAIWVVVLIVHSGAMRPMAAATCASARTALVHETELKWKRKSYCVRDPRVAGSRSTEMMRDYACVL